MSYLLDDQSCVRCPALVASRRRIVHGYGDPSARIVFIGEAPGRHGADRTGVPFSITSGFDAGLLGNNFATPRPDRIAGCDIKANQSRIHWYNPDCFRLQAIGTLGNAGRNIGTSPSYTTLDVNLSKDTKMTETTNLQFRAEFFNILNHTNFSTPTLGAFSSTGTPNPNAGTITSIVGTSRQIQFALKVLF